MWVLILDSTQAQVESRNLGPQKIFVLVIWWTGLGLLQLYLADYESSCAQNMNLTTHTYSYMQIYIHCKPKRLRNSKEINKKQIRMLGILKK